MKKREEKLLSPAKIKLFADEVARMQDFLSLGDWDIYVKAALLKDCRAEIHWDTRSKSASVYISDVDKPGLDPIESARHEIFELLLVPLTRELVDYVAQERINKIAHSIIHRLVRMTNKIEGEER